jgi:hypothetical protein
MRTLDVQGYLAELGLPSGDNYRLPTSDNRFPDGAHFRMEELPTTLDQYRSMFALCDELGFAVNRISDVRGVMFDSDEEILGKLELARQHGCEVIMAPGPGEQPFDISQQAEIHQIVEGKLRGMDNVAYTVESMLRASELGCRGFLMYDEGVLLIALSMRQAGHLPAATKFKISSNISVANAAAVKFWFDILGEQDEINPIRDLTLPMMAAIRGVTDRAIDIHVFHRAAVSRIMEAHEIVRIAAPVYLKNARFGPTFTTEDRTRQCFRIIEAIREKYPDARQSVPGAAGLAIPVDSRNLEIRAENGAISVSR